MITETEAKILAAARGICKELQKRARDEVADSPEVQAYNLGQFNEACSAADTAVFNVLSTASCMLDDKTAETYVHTREPVTLSTP